MFVGVAASLRSWLESLDERELAPEQAETLLDELLELERLVAAKRALVASRAAEAGAWRREGARSPESWLARKAGSTVAAARGSMEAVANAAAVPDVDEALRRGALSPTQAELVAEAAKADPAAVGELLDAARQESVAELRRRAERVKAAARSADDEQRRHEQIRRARCLRTTVRDGEFELYAKGPADEGAMLMARLEPFVTERFEAARQQGEHEARDAYAWDALLAMSEHGGSSRSPAKVIVRVDLPALRRGTTEPGEVCEIAGYGPIPVAVALRHMNEAFLALLVTRGQDVVTVAHLGRQFSEVQKTALEWRDPECVAVGCCATARLERDHREDWADTHVTRVVAADRLCHHHHGLKTQGWRLEAGVGKRRLLPP